MSWEDAAAHAIVQRAMDRFKAHRDEIYRATDRMFAGLMLAPWIFGILMAVVFTPYAWEGRSRRSTRTCSPRWCWGR
jgi:hypothetical protein